MQEPAGRGSERCGCLSDRPLALHVSLGEGRPQKTLRGPSQVWAGRMIPEGLTQHLICPKFQDTSSVITTVHNWSSLSSVRTPADPTFTVLPIFYRGLGHGWEVALAPENNRQLSVLVRATHSLNFKTIKTEAVNSRVCTSLWSLWARQGGWVRTGVNWEAHRTLGSHLPGPAG